MKTRILTYYCWVCGKTDSMPHLGNMATLLGNFIENKSSPYSIIKANIRESRDRQHN